MTTAEGPGSPKRNTQVDKLIRESIGKSLLPSLKEKLESEKLHLGRLLTNIDNQRLDSGPESVILVENFLNSVRQLVQINIVPKNPYDTILSRRTFIASAVSGVVSASIGATIGILLKAAEKNNGTEVSMKDVNSSAIIGALSGLTIGVSLPILFKELEKINFDYKKEKLSSILGVLKSLDDDSSELAKFISKYGENSVELLKVALLAIELQDQIFELEK